MAIIDFFFSYNYFISDNTDNNGKIRKDLAKRICRGIVSIYSNPLCV